MGLFRVLTRPRIHDIINIPSEGIYTLRGYVLEKLHPFRGVFFYVHYFPRGSLLLKSIPRKGSRLTVHLCIDITPRKTNIP